MLNDGYEPRADGEERLLEAFKEGGRTRPSSMYDEIDASTGAGQHWLDRLVAAGWIRRPERGLYEFAHDPREMSDDELALLFLEHALELDRSTVYGFLEGGPATDE